MTRIFPLSLADFALRLPIKHFDWKLEDQQEISGTAGGVLIGFDAAPRYWRSTVVLDDMSHQEAGEIEALIESLDGVLSTFYFHDPRRPYPVYDPTGSILGANTVRIKEVGSNNKEIKLKGLPAGYKISLGDWFCRDYASSPVHRGYYRVGSETVTADGSGDTDWIEFRQHFYPSSAAVDDVITLKRPAALCKIQPRSFNPGQSRGTRKSGLSFDIRQVI